MGPGEQVGAARWPALQDPALLGADVGLDLLVDRDGGLAAHLGVDVTQIRRALAVVEQAVEGQRAGARDPQPAADEDQGYQPAGWIWPSVEVGRQLDLGHDVLGELPGDLLGRGWAVAG